MNLSKRISYLYLAQESVLLIIFSYLVFFAGSKFSLVNPQILLINAILLTLMLGVLIKKKRVTQSPIHLPLAVMLGVMLFASLTSIDPRRSLAEWVLVSAALCLFFLVSDLVTGGWPGELVIKVVLLVGAIFMVLCWVEFIQWYFPWITMHPGIWLPTTPFRLSNPNLVAVLVNVWLMMALGRLATSRTLLTRILLGLWVLSALCVLFLTSSRGGWLGLAAGMVCMGYLFLRAKREIVASAWNKIKNNRALLSFLGMVILVMLMGVGLLAYRQLDQPTHGSRNEFWGPAIQTFLSSPLLGNGPHTFISAYLQGLSVPPSIFFDYAHSIYMDLLSGTGILGLLAFLWLMIMVVKVLWRQLNDSTGESWGLTAGALAALTAFCVHGFVDSVHHTEPISLWNLCIIMAAVLIQQPGQSKPPSWPRFFKISLTLMVIVFSWFNVWAILPFQAGLEAANQGDWLAAEKSFDQAIARDQTMAITHQQSGYVLSQEASAGDLSKLQPAIAAFERAVQMDPYWALNQANLGALYLASGNMEASQATFTRAVQLAPGSPIYQLNLGVVAETRRDSTISTAAYQQALTLAPQWRESYFWRATSFRKEVKQSWTATLPPTPAPKTLPQLEQEISLSPTTVQPYLDLTQAYLDHGQVDQAESTINKAIVNLSAGGDEIDWLKVELLAQRGDPSQAAIIGEMMVQNQFISNLFGPGVPGNAFYDIYMFRRPAIAIDLVPQMKTIPLNDLWGQRALKLAGWFEQAGYPEKAKSWRDRIYKEIPDLDSLIQHNLSQ